ncbi:MAG: desulfoferrodoxin family protein [Coriobacteriales bacterium]|jgi:superoxide reductase
MVDIKFYICSHCGNIITKIVDGGPIPVCCGETMTELVPNTVDAAQEKHVPVIAIDGQTVTVKVGEVEHPMAEDHYIQFIALHTTAGLQISQLKPGDKPEATFAVPADAKVVEAFEHCNKHGLWVAKA